MHVLILGGDGYLGWPTAMRFSANSHSVTVVDSYFRRQCCQEMGVDFLFPTPSLIERADIWHAKTGKTIQVVIGDLSNAEFMRQLLTTNKFDTIIHYAEQPSAPYSLYNYETANRTLINNLTVTNNLMFAVKDFCPQTHIIKLGTMGEYGTPNIDIEEGWLEVEHKGRKDTFLFPRQAGSLYHTTKIMDTDLLWFGVRTWGLRVTDLMQGPVYGIDTKETELDGRLRPFFNYDEFFGTVINRFVVQTVAGYPLTVFGKGGQTRGYLNIKDTLQCVELAMQNPPEAGHLQIFNQVMETFSVNELAKKVQTAGVQLGYDVKIDHLKNPRKEAESHYYNPMYQGLRDLGVQPHFLTEEVLVKMIQVVEQYKKNIRQETIFNGVKW